MTVEDLMDGVTVNASFTGFVTNDDFVLAINTGSATSELDYEVLQMGVAGVDAQMNPITQDKIYIRAGQSTTKTGEQRTFAVSGDRYIGDAAQDFCLGHDIAFGTGQTVVTDYVYFCIITGKGEKGKAAIIVNSTGGGEAGNNAEFAVDIKKTGAKPTEYTYSES